MFLSVLFCTGCILDSLCFRFPSISMILWFCFDGFAVSVIDVLYVYSLFATASLDHIVSALNG